MKCLLASIRQKRKGLGNGHQPSSARMETQASKEELPAGNLLKEDGKAPPQRDVLHSDSWASGVKRMGPHGKQRLL